MMVEIRPFSAEHVKEVARIERDSFSDPWSERMLEAELYNPLAVYFVAQDGPRVVGYAGFLAVLDEGQVTNVAVLPGYRRLGIGTGLVEKMIACAAQRGIASLTLEVRAGNVAAIGLYAYLGFKIDGLRQGYYAAPAEDALLMRLTL